MKKFRIIFTIIKAVYLCPTTIKHYYIILIHFYPQNFQHSAYARESMSPSRDYPKPWLDYLIDEGYIYIRSFRHLSLNPQNPKLLQLLGFI